jgi:hypothetical protein
MSTTIPRAIICDLDGTLADCRHRLHFVEEPPMWTPTPHPYDPMKWNMTSEPWKNWKSDWDAFYAAMGDDKVNLWCEKLCMSCLYADADCHLIFVTGRPLKYIEITMNWIRKTVLKKERFLPQWLLFMRPDYLPLPNCICGFKEHSNMPRLDIVCPHCDFCHDRKPDHRPAAVVKREIFEREIRGKYDVLFVLEDSDDCASMYRDLGLTVLKVLS